MEIRRKLLLIVTASILVTAVPGGALIYRYAQRNMLATQTALLEVATSWFATAVLQQFARSEPKLKALTDQLEHDLEADIRADEVLAFDRMAHRGADGVWRNREPGFDGSKESGLFLPEGNGLSAGQKVQHLRIKQRLDQFGPAASAPTENLWYLSPQRSEIIFDRAYPRFAFEQTADNDYTQTPWVTLTTPQHNPERALRFTPALFDPVPKVWMVSAVRPVYVRDQWVGAVGEDMPLTGLFDKLLHQKAMYSGVQHFLLDQNGNYMLAGPWQKELESASVAFRPDLRQEQQLDRLLASPVSVKPAALGSELLFNGKPYLAIGARLEPLGWQYFRLFPVEEVQAPIQHLFMMLGAMALLVTAASGMLIGTAVSSNMTRRIRQLRDVMQGYAHNNALRVSPSQAGTDEIGQVAIAYNALADSIDDSISARVQAQAALASNEELWRLALEGAGHGVWDWNLAQDTASFSQRSQDMMGLPALMQGDVSHSWFGRIHPQDKVDAIREMQAYLSGATPTYVGEFRVRCQDGSYKWVLHQGRIASRDANGRPLRAIGTQTDVTERKLAETRLADNQLLLHTLLNAIPDMVWLKDLDGVYLACNQRFEQFFGASEHDIAGRTDYDFVDRALADFFRANDQAAVEAGGLRMNEEWVTFANDGHRELLETTKLPVHGAEGQVIGVLGIGHDVTKSRELADALALREQYQRALLDTFPFFVWLKDEQSRFLAVNQRFASALEWGSVQSLIGKTDRDVSSPELAEAYLADDQAVLASGQPKELEEIVVVHGERRWHETYKSPVSINGRVIGTVGFARDITTRKQAEEDLKLAASVFSHAREGIMITRADGTIVNVNEAFERITGYTREEALGQTPRLLNSGRQSPAFYTDLWRDLLAQGYWYGEVWNRRKNGEVYAEMQTISMVRDAQGQPQHYVSLFSDITASKEHQRQLEHIAHFDALTSLPNRVLLADRLHQAVSQCQRRGQLLAVAYLDLDGFKAINDSFGHDAGDQLLMAVSARMRDTLRDGDTLARIGGDEFVAVLVDLSDVGACVPLLTRLLAAASQTLQVGEHKLQVSASLGVTFYPQSDDVEAEQLLRQADQAMYQAKTAGKNRFHIFDAEQDRSARGHHESLEHIRRALVQQEFVLFYQPKVNVRTGQVIGAEALIRWQHPQQGLLAPGMFLPVIENHPLAVDIGEWVLHTALTQMELWHSQGLDLPVSVNVGARQLQQPDFVSRLAEILAQHPQVRPSCLELEVLETSALGDIAGVSQVIETCRAMGVMFALDDFGTGYSSLTYLKRLPVTLLKIDQSFVRDMLADPDDLAILQGVIGLAQAFHRQVIAEGVETRAHGARLLELGCELAQGYGIARPMPAVSMPLWVGNWHTQAVWVA
jgi:diguanylate cyclase (GGDEF)-like protein/PAS domain S-box-containing protein